MFVHRLVQTIGGMVAVLQGLDALVFTGGIGEHSAEIRAAACASFGFLGLRLDDRRNASEPVDVDVAAADSQVRVVVLAAREDLAILREVRRVLKWS
jgi:acetate kinase